MTYTQLQPERAIPPCSGAVALPRLAPAMAAQRDFPVLVADLTYTQLQPGRAMPSRSCAMVRSGPAASMIGQWDRCRSWA